jgi:pyruvate formate lyase activating enzyme
MEIGKVNKILPRSFVDGPGNRAVIFLQGCNFHCLYCHNPYTINECSHCGVCVGHCPERALIFEGKKVRWIEGKCADCDTCIDVCQFFSSPKVKQMTAVDVWEELKDLQPFISGVSVSGGEPTLQIPFMTELLRTVKERSSLNTLMETNGYIDSEYVKPMLPYLDMVQVDLKACEDEIHRTLTGNPNQPVKDSIRFYAEKGVLYSVQQVIVNQYTNSPEQVAATAEFLSGINPDIRLQLVKFRPHGTAGEAKSWLSPTDEQMKRLSETASVYGLNYVHVSL